MSIQVYIIETLKQAQTQNKEFSINQKCKCFINSVYFSLTQANYFNTNIACKVYYIELKNCKIKTHEEEL